MIKLAQKHCRECAAGTEPLRGEGLAEYFEQLGEGWQVVDEHHLTKSWKFPNFQHALDFVNRIGELAEHEGHHPDIFLSYGRACVEVWTHKIDGLSEADFVMADKIDEIPTD